jgi:hypothetical protein
MLRASPSQLTLGGFALSTHARGLHPLLGASPSQPTLGGFALCSGVLPSRPTLGGFALCLGASPSRPTLGSFALEGFRSIENKNFPTEANKKAKI